MRRLVILLALVACGEDAGEPPAVDTVLTVWNRSQFELLELYVHDGESYDGAASLLTAPLPVEATVEVPFHTGQRVTVVRKKIEVGEEIALTTAQDLTQVGAEGFTLIVFDEAFRLMEP